MKNIVNKLFRLLFFNVTIVNSFYCMEKLPTPQSYKDLVSWTNNTFGPLTTNQFNFSFIPFIHTYFKHFERWSVQPQFDVKNNTIQPWETKLNKEKLTRAIQQYKVHLMPKTTNIPCTIKKILNLLSSDKDLLKGIFRVKAIVAVPEKQYEKHKAPKIVIYIKGKDFAQQTLNKIYQEFCHVEGTGQAPAFNEHVTDFIFFAQGNRNLKQNERHQPPESIIYERPQMVYFNPYKLEQEFGITLKEKDFHLKNPAQE